MKTYLTIIAAGCMTLLTSNASAQDLIHSWSHAYGSTAPEEGKAVVYDDQGNVYTAGYFQGFCDFYPGPPVNNVLSTGLYDIFVSKTTAAGNQLWVKTVPNTEMTSADQARSIAIDGDGNIYVAGLISLGTLDFDPGPGTYNVSPSGRSVFIWKLAPNGTTIWAKEFGSTDFTSSCNLKIKDDMLFITGMFQYSDDFDPGPGTAMLTNNGNYDAFLVKLDTAGTFQWANSYGSAGYDWGSDLTIHDDGSVTLVGVFAETVDFNPNGTAMPLTSSGVASAFVMNIDQSGGTNWAQPLDGDFIVDATGVTRDPDGNVYVCGSFEGVADFDPGAGTVNYMASNKDAFVLKLTPAGNYIWSDHLVDGALDCYANDIAINNNELFITGSFQGTPDFDPEAGILPMASKGNYDVFVSNIDTLGALVWVGTFGGNGAESGDQGNGIAVDAENRVAVTGGFLSTVDFDMGTDTVEITAKGSSDVFVLQLYKNYAGIESNGLLPEIKLYPNPTTDQVTIETKAADHKILIRNANGALIRELYGSNTYTLDTYELSSGMYYITITGSFGSTTKKLVVR